MSNAYQAALIGLLLVAQARPAAASCVSKQQIDADPDNAQQFAITLSQQLPTRVKVTLVGQNDGVTITKTFDAIAGLQWATITSKQKYDVLVQVAPVAGDNQSLFGFACFESGTNDWAVGYMSSAVGAIDATTAFARLSVSVRAKQNSRSALATLSLSAGSAAPPLDASGNRAKIPDPLQQTLQSLAEIALDRAKGAALRLFQDKIVATVCTELTIGRVFGGHVAKEAGGARLLPSICGQLENLRLGDLGGSANGLLTGLREDLASVVVPALVDLVAGHADPGLTRLLSTLVSRATTGGFTIDEVKLALIAFVTDEKDRLALGANRAGPIAERLLAATIEIASTCLEGCTGADIVQQLKARLPLRKLLGELVVRFAVADGLGAITLADQNALDRLKKIFEDRAQVEAVGEAVITLVVENRQDPVDAVLMTLATKLKTAVGDPTDYLPPLRVATSTLKLDTRLRDWLRLPTVSLVIALSARIHGLENALPELAASVGRMKHALNPPAGTSATQQARDVASVVLDVMGIVTCGSDATCRAKTNELKDIVEGALDGDYLRALGGLTAALQRAQVEPRYRRAFMLVASVMSYVDTYQKTKDQDPKAAHDARRNALEALIDAGTDRTGRDPGLVVSLGANVGLLGGVRRLPYVANTGKLLDGSITGDSFSFTSDLQLSLGFTFLWLKEQSAQCFLSASFVDLGQFVITDGPGTSSELQWSDFVHIGGSFGLAWNRRIPFVIGVQASWAPTLRFEYDVSKGNSADPGMTLTEKRTTEGVFRAGLFVGFTVPFLDF